MSKKFAKISKNTENYLADRLEEIVSLIEEGDNPNTAIAKVASEYNLPTNYVRLLVNSYNIGRTNLQRLYGTDWQTKSAAFTLADFDQVLRNIYHTDRDQPQEISDDYFSPPIAPTLHKTAEAHTVDDPSQLLSSPYRYWKEVTPFEQYCDLKRKWHQQCESIREQLVKTNVKIAQAKKYIEDYLIRHPDISWDRIRERIQASLGPSIQSLLDNYFYKWGVYSRQNGYAPPLRWDKEPYNHILEALESILIKENLSSTIEKLAKAAEVILESSKHFKLADTDKIDQMSVLSDLMKNKTDLPPSTEQQKHQHAKEQADKQQHEKEKPSGLVGHIGDREVGIGMSAGTVLPPKGQESELNKDDDTEDKKAAERAISSIAPEKKT